MSNLEQRMEIPLSKEKMVLQLIGALAFVAAGLWFIFSPPVSSNPIFGNPDVIFIAGIAAVGFFGFCAIYIMYKLPDNKPGLVIDGVGITDNSSATSAGQILWTDIESIAITTIQKQRLLMIKVTNPKQYIDKQPNRIKRQMMTLNYKLYGTPISVTANTLKTNFDELYKIIAERLSNTKISQ